MFYILAGLFPFRQPALSGICHRAARSETVVSFCCQECRRLAQTARCVLASCAWVWQNNLNEWQYAGRRYTVFNYGQKERFANWRVGHVFPEMWNKIWAAMFGFGLKHPVMSKVISSACLLALYIIGEMRCFVSPPHAGLQNNNEAVSAWRKICSRLFSMSIFQSSNLLDLLFFHYNTEGNAKLSIFFPAPLKMISAARWHFVFLY